MNISQELHKELVFFLKKQNNMKDSELEILFLYSVFRNIKKQNRIKETMFKKLIKNYKNNAQYTATNINTLDIIYNKDENSNIRFTVNNLKKFLISSNLDKYKSIVVEKSKINWKKNSNTDTRQSLGFINKWQQFRYNVTEIIDTRFPRQRVGAKKGLSLGANQFNESVRLSGFGQQVDYLANSIIAN